MALKLSRAEIHRTFIETRIENVASAVSDNACPERGEERIAMKAMITTDGIAPISKGL